MTYFCPQCFAQIAKETIDCPACGIHVPSWQQTLDYTDRLIHALNHPLAEVRMGAIISLGNRGDPRAALPLARCALGHPTDIVEGLEIVDRLCQLTESVERTQALQMLANSHPGRVV